MSKKLDILLHSMFTENTGKNLLDSGGAYGRNWERNQSKTIDNFINAPTATIEVRKYERNGKVEWDISLTLSLFHQLRQCLELDQLCDEFNAMDVGNWNGEYYGTDQDQCQWLEDQGFTADGGFNSYNWCANFTQVVQGQYLDLSGESYVLLQIHGGCDVRGGYTNAKLFKVTCDDGYLLDESAGFGVETADGEYLTLTWSGEWINTDGGCADDDDIAKFCESIGEGIHSGDLFTTC